MKRGHTKMLRSALPWAAAGIGLGTALAFRHFRLANITGQVVLITGGSRGLGLALAREFAAHGCKLAICSRDERHLETARQSLDNRGATVFATPCDVSDRSQVDRMVTQVQSRLGDIDILVNNAGIIRVAPLENSTVEDFKQAMGVMFWGVVYPTLAVLPSMRSRGAGRIAAITSVGGKVSVPHLLPYCCAKFAAVGFCEGLRAEVAQHGIRVTTIVPGLMRTGSHQHAAFGGKIESEAKWFGLCATLPMASISAEAAARQIVRSIRRGAAECILTLQANLLATLHGVFPGLVTEAMRGVNRLLPAPAGDHQTEAGMSIEQHMPAWWKAATTLGRRAAIRLNQ